MLTPMRTPKLVVNLPILMVRKNYFSHGVNVAIRNQHVAQPSDEMQAGSGPQPWLEPTWLEPRWLEPEFIRRSVVDVASLSTGELRK